MQFKKYLTLPIDCDQLISRNSLARGIMFAPGISKLQRLYRFVAEIPDTEEEHVNNYAKKIPKCQTLPRGNSLIYLSIYSDRIALPGQRRLVYLQSALAAIGQNKDFYYVLCVDLGDTGFDDLTLNKTPKNIKKIFALNATANDSRVICFPIGICNPFEKESTRVQFTNYANQYICRKNRKLACCGPYGIGSLSLCGEKPRKLIERDRERAKLLLKMDDYPWITVQFTKIPFQNYLEFLSNHKFVLSPEGKGLDCHRTWEALYLKSIPVILQNNYLRCYDDLPVVVVKDYSEISEDFLAEQYERISDNHFNFDKLKKGYWDALIEKEERSL